MRGGEYLKYKRHGPQSWIIFTFSTILRDDFFFYKSLLRSAARCELTLHSFPIERRKIGSINCCVTLHVRVFVYISYLPVACIANIYSTIVRTYVYYVYIIFSSTPVSVQGIA